MRYGAQANTSKISSGTGPALLSWGKPSNHPLLASFDWTTAQQADHALRKTTTAHTHTGALPKKRAISTALHAMGCRQSCAKQVQLTNLMSRATDRPAGSAAQLIRRGVGLYNFIRTRACRAGHAVVSKMTTFHYVNRGLEKAITFEQVESRFRRHRYGIHHPNDTSSAGWPKDIRDDGSS